jgi:hypothetical protein
MNPKSPTIRFTSEKGKREQKRDMNPKSPVIRITKEVIKMGNSMELEPIPIQMEPPIGGSGRTASIMAKVHNVVLMAVH